jgi:hypothetical protein
MSPSATIVTVVVALVFFAWLFQSDTKDPGYEAWVKRQQEERKNDQAQKASMGIAVTDPGVTKENGRPPRRDPSLAPGESPRDGDQVIPDDGSGIASLDQDGAPTTRPVQFNARPGFGNGLKLDGTFVGPADPVLSTAERDLPTITFRRDGAFHTQNMATAEVDMEAGNTGILAPLDRGSGRYRLAVNTLELTYTDGLTRRKGNRRVYTVVPVEGPEAAPTAIAIQGKVFKLKTAQ